MTDRRLLLLAVITAIAVAAAVVSLVVVERGGTVRDRSLLFPGIEDRLDRVATITVSDGTSGVTLKRAPHGRWGVVEKGDYPADLALMRRLLLGFTQIRVIEAKTNVPANYHRLGVADPGDAGADPDSRRITLAANDGTVIGDLLVGHEAGGAAPGGSGGGRRFVRIAGDAQSWLAEGVPAPRADPMWWVGGTVVEIPRERVQRVTVTHDAAETYTIARAAPGADFDLHPAAEGREYKAHGGPADVAAALTFVTFEDVRPAVADPGAPDAVVTFVTFDGLTLVVRLHGPWAHFSAIHDPAVVAEGGDAAIFPAAPADSLGEVNDIADRHASWDYRLPDYTLRDLAPRRDDLLKSAASDNQP